MSVHPEAVSPRTAGDVNFNYLLEWHLVDCCERIELVVECVAIEVMQIEQQPRTAVPRNRVQQSDIAGNFWIGWQIAKVVSRVFQEKRYAVTLHNRLAACGDKRG